MIENDTKNIAMKVSVVSVVINLILSILKLIAGILAHSGAMISDAVHSASDVFSTFIVMIGITLAGKDEDKDHPYGHERLECIASLILAFVLFLTGAEIGKAGIETIIAGNYSKLAVPGMLALIAAVVSIVVKEWMYWYTRAAAIKTKSSVLMADAWHHRTDSLSSIGAFIGIMGARMGYPVMDSVASVVICIFIIKAAYDILKEAVDGLVDKACSDEYVEKIKDTICHCNEVLGIDDIKTRMFGSKTYVDVEISVEPSLTLLEAHDIAENVHSKIEEEFPEVKHCMVHVNPKIK